MRTGINMALNSYYATHTHTRLTALCPGLPGWAGTRKAKPIWILLKHETVSGSGISWAICKSAPRCRQITMPAPHHSSFSQAGCRSCHPTNSVKAVRAEEKKEVSGGVMVGDEMTEEWREVVVESREDRVRVCLFQILVWSVCTVATMGKMSAEIFDKNFAILGLPVFASRAEIWRAKVVAWSVLTCQILPRKVYVVAPEWRKICQTLRFWPNFEICAPHGCVPLFQSVPDLAHDVTVYPWFTYAYQFSSDRFILSPMGTSPQFKNLLYFKVFILFISLLH